MCEGGGERDNEKAREKCGCICIVEKCVEMKFHNNKDECLEDKNKEIMMDLEEGIRDMMMDNIATIDMSLVYLSSSINIASNEAMVATPPVIGLPKRRNKIVVAIKGSPWLYIHAVVSGSSLQSKHPKKRENNKVGQVKIEKISSSV